MKIALPVDENNMETKVCVSFGRAPYFLIYDTEKKENVFIQNTAAESQGGAGIKAAQMVLDQKVQTLLTPRCGENAAEVLKAAKISIYKTINDRPKDNIEAFLESKLEPLYDIHAGFHGHKGE